MEDFVLWGTLVNAAGVVGGSLVGMLVGKLSKKLAQRLDKANKRPWKADNDRETEPMSKVIFKALALCVLLVGMGGALKGAMNDAISSALIHGGVAQVSLPGEKTLVIIFSMVIGTVIGTLLNLETRFDHFGEWLERKLGGKDNNIAQGFVAASMLFCMGSLTIVGALNSGLRCDHSLLYTKTMLDTVSSIVFGYTMGVGVLLSSLFVLTFQGSIALLAQWIAPLLTDDVIMTMSAVGSILIFALGLKLLGVLKIKVLNHLPAVFMPVLLMPVFSFFGLA